MPDGRDEVYRNEHERTLSLLAELKRLQDDAHAIGEEAVHKVNELIPPEERASTSTG